MEAAIASLENNTEEALVVTVPPEFRDLTRFCSALRRCRRLRRLGLRGLRTRSGAVQDIMAALADNSTLEVLDLSFNELGDACVKTVLVALTMGDARGAGGAAYGIHTLMLDSNSLDDSGAGVLTLLGLQHRLRKVRVPCASAGDARSAKERASMMRLQENTVSESRPAPHSRVAIYPLTTGKRR